MPSRPYFPMYPADYLADTAHLTLEEHGFYLLLLLNLWQYNGELPADEKELSRMLRCSLRVTKRILGGKLRENFVIVSGKLTNPRMTKELRQVAEKHKKLSEAGKLGNKIKHSPGDTPGGRIPEPEPDKDSTNVEPLNIAAGAAPPFKLEKPCSKKTRIPYQKIVDLYHEVLPNNPRILELNETRKRYIKSQWDGQPDELEQWKNYFEYCAESKFLTGRAPGRNGGSPFIANLEWLTKPANVLKIREGQYHR